MKDATREEIIGSRPELGVREALLFCLVKLFDDTKKCMSNEVVKGLTYEELIGTILLAIDATNEADESDNNFGIDARTMKALDLSPIRARFGQWAVTDYGIESVDPEWYYPIEGSQIDENDWLSHMGEKTWVNIGDFTAALNYAKGETFVT